MTGLVAAGLAAISSSALADFPTDIFLADLDGRNGFALNGAHEEALSGTSVSDAGDINGDGLPDLIIGAPLATVNGVNSGVTYVLFGRDTAAEGDFPSAVELSSLDGTNGFALNGVNENDNSAFSVSGAGDINGDGIADIAIGAPEADPNGIKSGVTYVVFGRDTAADGNFPAAVELSAIDGRNGFAIRGKAASEEFGFAVSDAGDINGDGLADLIIGARADSSDEPQPGAAYVVFGRDTDVDGDFPAMIETAALNGTNGFMLNGNNPRDFTGSSVSGAGDVNDDGVADIIIGALGADPSGETSGASYVVFGRDTAADGDFPASLELAALDGRSGFVVNGVNALDGSGTSVSGGGDINDDGIADIVIGAPYADPNGRYSGASYVVFGRNTARDGTFPARVWLASLNGDNGFVINGERELDYSGHSVKDAGDFDGDGIADLILGAPVLGTNFPTVPYQPGASYVLFGRSTTDGGFPATLELSTLDGTNGFTLHGVKGQDHTGYSVSGTGDFNGDGRMDILIGAEVASPQGLQWAGVSYVVYGQGADAFAKAMVQCPGDINNDGIADIAVVGPNGDVRIRGLNGDLLSEFSFADLNAVVDIATMADINANGSPELVALGTGSVQAEVRDMLMGNRVSLIDFDPGLAPLDLELLHDQDGSGIPELAILNKLAPASAQVKDALSSGPVADVSFSRYLDPADLEIYPDLDGDGLPELGLLGTNDGTSKSDKLELRSLLTGELVREIFMNRIWQARQHKWVKDINNNGYPEAAVLRTGLWDDRNQVILRDTGPNKQHLGFIYMDSHFPPLKLLKTPDLNGNGSDEVVVFGRHVNGDSQKAQIKDSKTRQRINAVFFDKNAPGQDIATCADINGNGTAELVLLGRRSKDGKLKAIVKDAKTGERIAVVKF